MTRAAPLTELGRTLQDIMYLGNTLLVNQPYYFVAVILG